MLNWRRPSADQVWLTIASILATFNIGKAKDSSGNEIAISDEYDDFGLLVWAACSAPASSPLTCMISPATRRVLSAQSPHDRATIISSSKRWTYRMNECSGRSVSSKRAFFAFHNCLDFVTSTCYAVLFPVSHHFEYSVRLGLGHPSTVLFLLAFGLGLSR